jgi:hypothetical protein
MGNAAIVAKGKPTASAAYLAHPESEGMAALPTHTPVKADTASVSKRRVAGDGIIAMAFLICSTITLLLGWLTLK